MKNVSSPKDFKKCFDELIFIKNMENSLIENGILEKSDNIEKDVLKNSGNIGRVEIRTKQLAEKLITNFSSLLEVSFSLKNRKVNKSYSCLPNCFSIMMDNKREDFENKIYSYFNKSNKYQDNIIHVMLNSYLIHRFQFKNLVVELVKKFIENPKSFGDKIIVSDILAVVFRLINIFSRNEREDLIIKKIKDLSIEFFKKFIENPELFNEEILMNFSYGLIFGADKLSKEDQTLIIKLYENFLKNQKVFNKLFNNLFYLVNYFIGKRLEKSKEIYDLTIEFLKEYKKNDEKFPEEIIDSMSFILRRFLKGNLNRAEEATNIIIKILKEAGILEESNTKIHLGLSKYAMINFFDILTSYIGNPEKKELLGRLKGPMIKLFKKAEKDPISFGFIEFCDLSSLLIKNYSIKDTKLVMKKFFKVINFLREKFIKILLANCNNVSFVFELIYNRIKNSKNFQEIAILFLETLMKLETRVKNVPGNEGLEIVMIDRIIKKLKNRIIKNKLKW